MENLKLKDIKAIYLDVVGVEMRFKFIFLRPSLSSFFIIVHMSVLLLER